jgi:hypothetical protein
MSTGSTPNGLTAVGFECIRLTTTTGHFPTIVEMEGRLWKKFWECAHLFMKGIKGEAMELYRAQQMASSYATGV